MSGARRLVLVLGEGAAIGLLVGGLLGGWEVWLNADLNHRMFWLAAHHLTGSMVAGAAWGMLASALLALLMVELRRRGRGPLWAGMVSLGVLWAAGLAALGFPFRERAFPLHRFSSYGLTRSVFGLIAVVSLLLLARRSWDALSRTGGPRGVVRSLRFATSVLAVASAGAPR